MPVAYSFGLAIDHAGHTTEPRASARLLILHLLCSVKIIFQIPDISTKQDVLITIKEGY
jgi:hypothetical protein